MSDQTPPQNQPGPEDDPTGQPPELTEAEREMLEQQMKEIRVEDLLAQTVASVLNLSARRIVKEDEVDLEQARIGIEAVRAIVDLLPAERCPRFPEPRERTTVLLGHALRRLLLPIGAVDGPARVRFALRHFPEDDGA